MEVVRWTLPVLALTLGALTAGAAGAASPAPKTLAVAPGPVLAVAQDAGRVAWLARTPERRCRAAVVVSGTRVACTWASTQYPAKLGLRGSTALWTLKASGNITEEWVYSASLSSRRARDVDSAFHETDSRGDWLTDVADDAYAVVDTRGTAPAGAIGSATRPPVRIAAAKLAVDGVRFAYAAATSVDRSGAPFADAGATIAVREFRRSAVLAQVAAPGRVRALALAWPHVVAIVTVDGARTLFRYDASTGRTDRRALLPDASSLAASGRFAVYRTGRTIRAVDLSSSAPNVPVARAAATPIGLSVERGRVVWGENVRGRGRIRALTLSQ
jgi:hypothetical protein